MKRSHKGYHGTDLKNVNSIITKGYVPSGENEWFGTGVYFFEDLKPLTNGFQEARSWAVYVCGLKFYAIFKAVITSKKFIDIAGCREHRILYDEVKEKLHNLHIKSGKKEKTFSDNIVFTFLSQEYQIDFIRVLVDAARQKDIQFSYVIRRPQLQICVKNTTCIIKNFCIYKSEKYILNGG